MNSRHANASSAGTGDYVVPSASNSHDDHEILGFDEGADAAHLAGSTRNNGPAGLVVSRGFNWLGAGLPALGASALINDLFAEGRHKLDEVYARNDAPQVQHAQPVYFSGPQNALATAESLYSAGSQQDALERNQESVRESPDNLVTIPDDVVVPDVFTAKTEAPLQPTTADATDEAVHPQYALPTDEVADRPADEPMPPAIQSAVLTDDVGPVLGTIGRGDITDDTKPTFAGTTNPNAIVRIFDNGVDIGSVLADDQGHWSFTPSVDLGEGVHSFAAQATNLAGLTGPLSPAVDFTVDTSVTGGAVSAVSVDDGAADVSLHDVLQAGEASLFAPQSDAVSLHDASVGLSVSPVVPVPDATTADGVAYPLYDSNAHNDDLLARQVISPDIV